jgi:DNA-binding MarR family transcriptional regulator
MIEYLHNIFGESVTVQGWHPSDTLPVFLHHQYIYSEIQINDIRFIAMKPTGDQQRLDAIEKHRDKIEISYEGPVALELNGLNSRQRNRLIQNKVPFIVDGSQLYLPFIGAHLSEKRSAFVPPATKMSFSTQMVFLHLYYLDPAENDTEPTVTNLAKVLGISMMSISRAVAQLKTMGLAEVETKGRKYLIGLSDRENILEKASPYLRSPVISEKSVKRSSITYGDLAIAGIPALSRKTMIAAGQTDIGYAIDSAAIRAHKRSKAGKAATVPEPSDAITFVKEEPTYYMDEDPDILKIEVWGYDPARFSADNSVDDVSLILSLRDNADERIRAAVESLKEQIGWFTE